MLRKVVRKSESRVAGDRSTPGPGDEVRLASLEGKKVIRRTEGSWCGLLNVCTRARFACFEERLFFSVVLDSVLEGWKE